LIPYIIYFSLYRQFPARAPLEGSVELEVMQQHDSNVNAGFGRSASRQAEFQIAALFMTLAVAIVGGILTGDRFVYL
jgi:ammonium transporter Rh